MRSFVTGVDGFIGLWLAEELGRQGDEVFGLSRAKEGASGAVHRFRGDLASASALADVIAQARPDRVFHLAALNNIKASFDDPRLTIETNVIGSVNLLDAVREAAPGAAFVSVGSSSEYGKTAASARALSEDLPLLPTSPYGISKVSQGDFSRVYAQVHKLRSMHVRPFAIVGPRKEKDALSDFCKNVVALERGQTDRFLIGNLSSERDFVDVRDCVAALVTISEKGEAGGVYNVCNGRSASLDDVLSLLRDLSRRPFTPTQDPSRLRPADDVRLIGDGARLAALGYVPRFALADTVKATLDYWRAAPDERRG